MMQRDDADATPDRSKLKQMISFVLRWMATFSPPYLSVFVGNLMSYDLGLPFHRILKSVSLILSYQTRFSLSATVAP